MANTSTRRRGRKTQSAQASLAWQQGILFWIAVGLIALGTLFLIATAALAIWLRLSLNFSVGEIGPLFAAASGAATGIGSGSLFGVGFKLLKMSQDQMDKRLKNENGHIKPP